MARRRPRQRKALSYVDIGGLAAVAFALTWWAVPRLQVAAMTPAERAAIETSVTYSGCEEVRAMGKDPIQAGQPGYRAAMDRDGDGTACEAYP